MPLKLFSAKTKCCDISATKLSRLTYEVTARFSIKKSGRPVTAEHLIGSTDAARAAKVQYVIAK